MQSIRKSTTYNILTGHYNYAFMRSCICIGNTKCRVAEARYIFQLQHRSNAYIRMLIDYCSDFYINK